MAMMGGDLLACWTTLVSPPTDDELSLQLIRSGAVAALDDSHRPPVVIMVDELRASFRDDGRRMNASGELRRPDDDGDDGGRCSGSGGGGGSACNRASADADRARPPPTSFCCLPVAAVGFGAASVNLATASMGRAVACSGM